MRTKYIPYIYDQEEGKKKKRKKIKLGSGYFDGRPPSDSSSSESQDPLTDCSILYPNPRTALQGSPAHFRPPWQALHDGRSKPYILVSQMISTSACLAICLRDFSMPNLLFNLEKVASI